MFINSTISDRLCVGKQSVVQCTSEYLEWNNTKWPIQVHEYILNFVPGIDLFSKENDNEQGKGDQKLDMGDIWLVEEK